MFNIKNTFIAGLVRAKISWAQEGEDLILERLFGKNITDGFYVDIGAHHPYRFSNTYRFYRRGWSGINVDALPGTAKLFHSKRPRDITVECGVADKSSSLTYHVFNEPALNTFSLEEANKKNVTPYRIIKTLQIPVRPLVDILDEHLPENTIIDFMSVDVEGFDYQVILSNDWIKYRPKIVLVELLRADIKDFLNVPIYQLLIKNNYNLLAKTMNTAFFIADEARF